MGRWLGWSSQPVGVWSWTFSWKIWWSLQESQRLWCWHWSLVISLGRLWLHTGLIFFDIFTPTKKWGRLWGMVFFDLSFFEGFFFPDSMLWGTSGLVGWLVPEPGFWVAKVRTVSEVAGRFGALGIWKDGRLLRFGSIGSFRRIARFQGIPRLRMDLFGLAKGDGGAGRPQNSYLSGWKKLVASPTKWILFELVGFWRQATDAPYSCKTATTNIWAEYVSEKGGWGCKKKHDNWCQIYHEKIAPELLLTPGGESEVWQKARWLGEGRQRISDIPRSSWCFMKYLGRLDINHFFCCLDLGFNIHPLCLFGRLWDELQPQPAVWRF